MKNTLRLVVLMMTALWLVMPAMVLAQNEAADDRAAEKKDDKNKPRGWLRILPVGDAPPFIQEIINGVRVEMPAPKGSLPPRQILVPAGGDKVEARRLQLGRATEPVVSTAGAHVLRELDAAGVEKPWMTVNMPEHPAALAIFFRDPRQNSWDAARSLVVKDDLETHPEGAVRVINASIYPVQAVVGEQGVELAPGKVMVRKRANPGAMEDIPLMVRVQTAEGWKVVYDSALAQGRGERTNVVVYRSDGEKPRRPAKVLVLKERSLLPKLPDKKKDPES
jgi:hypothetical protein